MATVDVTRGGTGGGYPAHLKGGSYRMVRTLDFNEVNRSSGDVLQLFNVPANTRVRSIAYKVQTAEGATLTFDIGDGDDVDGYIDGANGNTLNAGGDNSLVLAEAAPPTVLGYSGFGRRYAAADTIDLLLNNDAATAKITVIAVMEDQSVNE